MVSAKDYSQPASDSDEEEYVVQEILKMRMERGKREFFIRWKGYDPSYNTWEPEVNLSGSTGISILLILL
jgi:hypothetical protein